ncbi:hypothetical protein JTB14_029690 [Gonioctena quinquepunctata]|nr:hypothetical protein JTB14_029690 [Gonioctena quinquepunctata]
MECLPIGQLSEEAQEARNKEFKRYRECYSRKISRIKTNEDVLDLLLITSDPYITSRRKVPKRKALTFEKDVVALLKAPNVSCSQEREDNESSSDNDSDVWR